MSESKIEEIIATLWIIAAILCFANDFTSWGWMFAIKGALDTAGSIYLAFKETRYEKNQA